MYAERIISVFIACHLREQNAKKHNFLPKAITISRTKAQWKTDSRKRQKIQHIRGKRVSHHLFGTGGSSSDSNPWQHARRLRRVLDKSRLPPVTAVIILSFKWLCDSCVFSRTVLVSACVCRRNRFPTERVSRLHSFAEAQREDAGFGGEGRDHAGSDGGMSRTLQQLREPVPESRHLCGELQRLHLRLQSLSLHWNLLS